jgi:hypothetical protein
MAGLCERAERPFSLWNETLSLAKPSGLWQWPPPPTSAARRGRRRQPHGPSSRPGPAGSGVLIPAVLGARLFFLPPRLRRRAPPLPLSTPSSSGSSTTRSPALSKTARSATGYETPTAVPSFPLLFDAPSVSAQTPTNEMKGTTGVIRIACTPVVPSIEYAEINVCKKCRSN